MSTTKTKAATKTAKASTTKNNGEVSTSRLKDDVKSLATDTKQFASERAHSLADTTKDAVSNAKHHVIDAVNDAKESVVNVAHQSQDRAITEYDRCVDAIRRNPVAAVGIAAGVGLVTGILLLSGNKRSS